MLMIRSFQIYSMRASSVAATCTIHMPSSLALHGKVELHVAGELGVINTANIL